MKTDQRNAVEEGGECGGVPTVFVCISADFGPVTWHRVDVTSVVAKYIYFAAASDSSGQTRSG